MIEISSNFSLFKKGVFDTFKLFKTMYRDEHNILFLKNSNLYTNNIEQLVNNRHKVSDAYTFGIDFALQNLKNFRENICINPILYMIALETVLNSVSNLRELENYNVKKLSDFLQWYYKESNLPRAVITIDCIKKLFKKELEDKFLSEVINNVYIPSNVEIVESKQNRIIKHKYYKLKCTHISGSLFGNNCKVFMVTHLTKELLAALISLNTPVLLIYCDADFNLGDNYNVTALKVSVATYLKHYNDICILTGFGRGYQNLDIEELNNLSFGVVKEFKILEGELLFSSNNYLLANDSRLNDTKDRYSYYALQGKNLKIEVAEEYLERVRCIVSIIKSLQNNGIFYGETKTLKILIESFIKSDLLLSTLAQKILINYLSAHNFSKNLIEEVVTNKELKLNFDTSTGNYDDEFFTSLDYYLNVFNLLDSNIKVLSKLA